MSSYESLLKPVDYLGPYTPTVSEQCPFGATTDTAQTEPLPWAKTAAQPQSNQAAVKALPSEAKHADSVADFGETTGLDLIDTAGAALDWLVPGRGSTASLKFGFVIPIPLASGAQLNIDIGCVAEAARTASGASEALIGIYVGAIFSVGTSMLPSWMPTCITTFNLYVRGSLATSGDSGAENIRQLIYMLVHLLKWAAETAGASEDDAQELGEAILDGDEAADIIGAWDRDDEATASVAVEAGVGFKTSLGDASASAELSFAQRLTNRDNDPATLEEQSLVGLKFGATFQHAKRNAEAPVSMQLLWSDGVLVQSSMSLGVKFSLARTADNINMMALASTLGEMVHGLADVCSTIGAEAKEPKVAQLGVWVRALGGAQGLVKYGPTAEALERATDNNNFISEEAKKEAAEKRTKAKGAEQKMNLVFNADLGWSQEKGLYIRALIRTDETTTIGQLGVTPVYAEASKGDTLVSLEMSEKSETSFGT